MKTSLILPLVASIGCASLVSSDANADQIMSAAHALQNVLVESQEQNLFAKGSRRLTELPAGAMACLSKYPLFLRGTREKAKAA